MSVLCHSQRRGETNRTDVVDTNVASPLLFRQQQKNTRVAPPPLAFFRGQSRSRTKRRERRQQSGRGREERQDSNFEQFRALFDIERGPSYAPRQFLELEGLRRADWKRKPTTSHLRRDGRGGGGSFKLPSSPFVRATANS